MKVLHVVSFVLLVVAGLNMAAMVLANWDLSSVLGSQLTQIVYVLMGAAAVYEVATHKKNCKMCG